MLRFRNLIWAGKRKLSAALARVDGNSRVHRLATLNRGAQLINATVDRFSYVGPKTKIENTEIGAFCSISWECLIGLSSHEMECISTSPIFQERFNGTGTSWLEQDVERPSAVRTVIGNDVWVGARAILMEGVQIGDGAVIAAGAVVTKDVDPYTVVAGVPARMLRKRFSDEMVDQLQGLEWWDAPVPKIKRAIHLFQRNNLSPSVIAQLRQILS